MMEVDTIEPLSYRVKGIVLTVNCAIILEQ